MRIPLDRGSGRPLYRQIADHIAAGFHNGAFPEGCRLPSVRDLARRNGVGRATAEKAYDRLESLHLIQIRPGSGAFALALPSSAEKPASPPGAHAPFDQKTEGIDFSYGGADPELFPLGDFNECLRQAATHRKSELLGYGDPRGYAPLRESVSRLLSAQGPPVPPGQILLTNGSQQALSLICRRFLKRGSRVVVASLCYGEALNLFRAEGYELTPVPIDRNGMDTDALERLLKTTPADMIYAIPNFQNPTGATLIPERRAKLAYLAEKYGIPIIEDDYVGGFDYEGICPPPLRSFKGDAPYFSIGTFSKMLVPGLRFGYLCTRPAEYALLEQYKRYSDLSSPALIQIALEGFINMGRYRNHIERSRRTYRRRRDALLPLLQETLPETFRVSKPRGGIFLWVDYPDGLDETLLYERLAARGIRVAPGRLFQAHPRGYSGGFRLNFACMTAEKARQGIEGLSAAMLN